VKEYSMLKTFIIIADDRMTLSPRLALTGGSHA
jgi:hypothetical protein